MPRNEDGEFELVLGNRQLLSVFFLVVILMSVFFLMGYIVGRNSAPVTADAPPTRVGRPVVVESPTRTAPEGPAEKTAEKSAEQKVDAPPKAEPEKKAEEKKAEPEKKAELKPAKEEKPEPQKPEKKPESKKASPDTPVAGATYLQIAAVDDKASEVMVATLRQKGFGALAIQVPDKPQLFRVFVGPYPDASALADAKAKLTAAGFRGNEAFKKVF